ncbi:MAG: hypothetical protein PVG82_07595 [Chromatiales bacterium]
MPVRLGRAAAAELVLVVPDLLAPLSAPDWDPALGPRAPALEALLARGRWGPARTDGYEATLFDLLAAYPADERSLPIAEPCYRLDTQRQAAGSVLRADPVHLEAGIDELVLTPARDLAINEAEATALAAALSTHFESRGWRIEAPLPERWYLSAEQLPPLLALPPSRVIGRNPRAHLPEGSDARHWIAVLNEIQMLLHEHPVNRDREAAGRRPINGLWLWGAGPSGQRDSLIAGRVWARDALARALAEAAGLRCSELPVSLSDLEPDGRYLVVIDDLLWPARQGRNDQWSAALEAVNDRFLEPALRGLGRTWRTIEILPCDARSCRLRDSDRWRVWRRPRPLSTWAPAEQ